MTFYLTLLAILLIPSLLIARPISDISQSDPNYTAIKKSLDNNYLSLYDNNAFKPNTAISRREMALIIERIDQKINTKAATLTKEDISDLKALALSYKTLYSAHQNQETAIKETQARLLAEQKTLYHDLSLAQEEIQRSKKERILFFVLLGASGVLGILFGG